MRKESADILIWIARAGGHVTPRGLTFWRFPYGVAGSRNAIRKLSIFEGRGWLSRSGSERYPVFSLTRLGLLEARNEGLSYDVPLNPGASRIHDESVAAICEAGTREGLFRRWLPRFEFAVPKGQRTPDAVVLTKVGQDENERLVWLAIEYEASRKTGRAGHSTWEDLAQSTRNRMEASAEGRADESGEVLIDGETRRLYHTVVIAADESLQRALTKRLGGIAWSMVDDGGLELTADQIGVLDPVRTKRAPLPRRFPPPA